MSLVIVHVNEIKDLNKVYKEFQKENPEIWKKRQLKVEIKKVYGIFKNKEAL
jgi:hypothetical protein